MYVNVSIVSFICKGGQKTYRQKTRVLQKRNKVSDRMKRLKKGVQKKKEKKKETRRAICRLVIQPLKQS